MKKKILIAVGVIFGLFLILAIVLPLVVDVDKLRPKIESAVNEKINGEFKLGKLQLSLWGGIKVRIESLSITETGAKKPLVETNSAYMEIPLLSLLTFSPSLTAVLDAPKVDVIKFKNGKMNVTELMKPAALKEPTPKQETTTSSSGMPAMLVNASVGLRIENGVLGYTDESTNSKYAIDGLELDAQNIGLRDTMKISLKLPVKGSSPTMTVDGMISANASIKPIIANGEVRSASGTIDADATALAFKINNGMVNKTPKTPLVFTADFVGTENDVTLKSADIKFDEMSVSAKGIVILEPTKSVKMDITSSKLNLASLEKFVPMLKEYGLAGTAGMNVHADGPLEQLAINGDISVKGGKAAYPAMLKAPVGFDMNAAFTDKSLALKELTLTGPETDIKLSGTVKDFKAPQFAFNLNGKELNVDKLMKTAEPPKKDASYFSILHEAEAKPVYKEAPKKASKAAAKEESKEVAASGANPMLGLAKNPIVANAAGTLNVNLAKVIAKNATISDVVAKINLKNMDLSVPSATLKMFEGALSTNFNANLKSAGLNFSTTGTMSGLNTVPACQAFAPKFQHTLDGKINAKWTMEGLAFPTAALTHNLKGNASITSENGKLRTMDIGESIKGIFGKVPFLQGKSIPSIDENYKSMRAEIKMSGGVVTADPLEVIGSNKGVNVKGRSTIQENMNQDTYVDVFDPNHILPKEVSNGKDAALQLHITGPATAPQTDYGYTVGKLAKNVVRNQGADLIKKALGGKGGSGTSDAIGGALKKLGF